MRLLISEMFILPIKDENLYTEHFSVMNFSSPESQRNGPKPSLGIVFKGPIFSKPSEGKAVASVMGT